MIAYVVVSLVSGILFGTMDALINANPAGRKFNEVYKPIARTSINAPVGIVIDIAYGFAMSGIFMLLYNGFPGEIGLVKGISFAILAWFFRVIMSSASNWIMFKVGSRTLVYNLFTGLGEMLVLGIIYGLFLKP